VRCASRSQAADTVDPVRNWGGRPSIVRKTSTLSLRPMRLVMVWEAAAVAAGAWAGEKEVVLLLLLGGGVESSLLPLLRGICRRAYRRVLVLMRCLGSGRSGDRGGETKRRSEWGGRWEEWLGTSGVRDWER